MSWHLDAAARTCQCCFVYHSSPGVEMSPSNYLGNVVCCIQQRYNWCLQVTEPGTVDIAWSMWGQESHWAEMKSLRLRQKSNLVSYIDDLLQPENSMDVYMSSEAPPEDKTALFTHNTSIQLPVNLHGHVHPTGDPKCAGRTPRASLRLGMYKIKIYKRAAVALPTPDPNVSPAPVAPAASHGDPSAKTA